MRRSDGVLARRSFCSYSFVVVIVAKLLYDTERLRQLHVA